jgi:hypothetical protein
MMAISIRRMPFLLLSLLAAAVLAQPAVAIVSGGVGEGTPTSPDAELCAEEVLLIDAGQQIQFVGSHTLVGTWSAAFGSMAPDGSYLAPSAPPPDGLDVVDFVAANGTTASVTLRIQPAGSNPIPPGSPVWTDLGGQPTPDPPPGEAPPSSPLQGQGAAATCLQVGELSLVSSVEDGPVEDSPVEAPAATDIPGVMVNGTVLYPVPTQGSIITDPTLVLYAQASKPLQKAKRCGVLPVPPWKDDPCTSGAEKVVVGPTQTTSYSGFREWGEIEIKDTGMQLKIKDAFGISVGLHAKFKVFHMIRIYRQWYNKDVYRCVNGAWAFAYSRQCSRTGAQFFGWSPAWVALFNGNPSTQIEWSAWACRNLP